MFQSWSLKQTIIILGGLLLCLLLIQIYLFIVSRSTYVHFVLSFVELFIALLLFHSVNIKLKGIKKRKK
jgi:hypothetical protein